MFFFSSCMMARNAKTLVFSLSSIIALTFLGCTRDTNAPATGDVDQSELTSQDVSEFPQFSTEIKSLTSEQLNALGNKNNLPTEFVYPNASFVQVVYPERVASYKNGDATLDYLSYSPFQIPDHSLLNESELSIFSRVFTLESVKDPKTGEVLLDGFPSPVEIVYLKSKTPLDQNKLKTEAFKNADEDKLKEVSFGNHKVTYSPNALFVPLDQSGQKAGVIDDMNAGLCFPTDDSVVFMSGSIKAFESYLSEKGGDERGIAAQRLARIPLENVAVAFQYDVDFLSPNAQLVQLPIRLTPELGAVVQKEVTAFQLIFDPITPEGSLLKLNINAKSKEGANDLRKAIGSALMQIVDSLETEQKNNPSAQNNETIDGLIAMLKSIQLTTDDATVVGTVSASEERVTFISDRIKELNDLRLNSANRQKYQNIEQALDQLGKVFTRYSRENKHFPAAILADDGTPLLSWRVAILPYLGDQFKALYDQFRLNEPWNSDNNIKLLDKIPALFASSSQEPNKTQFLIFNSPGTPFGRAPQGLKLQDVEDPYKTFSVVYASPQNAIEWTKPENFVFNPSIPSDSFGDYVCGVTLVGELISAPCDDSETGAKSLAALVFGVPQDDDSANKTNSSEESSESNVQVDAEEIEESSNSPTDAKASDALEERAQ